MLVEHSAVRRLDLFSVELRLQCGFTYGNASAATSMRLLVNALKVK